MFGLRAQDAERAAHEVASRARRIVVGADGVLEPEDEAGADRLDDRGRPRLLAVRGSGW